MRDEEPLETLERRVRRTLKPPTSGAPVDYPPDAAMWNAKDEQSRKLAWQTKEGLEVYQWPISEFTVQTVRERWGPGAYRVHFFGRDGKPRSYRDFKILGPKDDVAPPAEVLPSVSSLARRDPTDTALAIFQTIDSVSQTKAQALVELQSKFLLGAQEHTARMFEAAMGRERAREAAAGNVSPELLKVLQNMDQRLQAVTAELAELRDDGDPDDDDPEGGGVPSFPESWDNAGQMIYRVLARQWPTLEKMLPDLLQGFLTQLQEKARAAAGGGPATVVDANGVAVSGAGS